MHYTFAASITKEGRWFVARAVELGVVSQGRTIQEARRNLSEAVELYLEREPAARRIVPREAPLFTTLEANV